MSDAGDWIDATSNNGMLEPSELPDEEGLSVLPDWFRYILQLYERSSL